MTGDPKDPKRRATGEGSELWAFICKKALKEACENVARERQLSIVQWLEEALQTAVDAHMRTNINRFMLVCLEQAPGEVVPLIEVYRRYREWCDERRTTPLDVTGFNEDFMAISEHVGLRTHQDEGHVYCLDVKLRDNMKTLAELLKRAED